MKVVFAELANKVFLRVPRFDDYDIQRIAVGELPRTGCHVELELDGDYLKVTLVDPRTDLKSVSLIPQTNITLLRVE